MSWKGESLIKLIKCGQYRNHDKIYRLKSISSIVDHYLEVATRGVLWKKVLKNFAIFTGKQLCWSLFLIKLQAWRPATLFKIDSNTGVFLRILRIFIYFEKHLRTAASDYSFTLVIYLFSTGADYYILSDISISDIWPQMWNSRPRI